MSHPYPVTRRGMLTLLATAGLVSASRNALAGEEPIAIVMGSSSGQKSITLDRLRRVFLAIPANDDDGNPFVPINQAQSSMARGRFDERVLSMSREAAARYWVDQKLRGKRPPRSAATNAMVRRALQELPGTISYLPVSAAASLRILTVDGRRPSDVGYALL